MAEDFLAQAALAALKGFEGAYVPFKQTEFQDFLARRRAKEEIALRGEEERRTRREFPNIYRDPTTGELIQVQGTLKFPPKPEGVVKTEKDVRQALAEGEKVPASTKILPEIKPTVSESSTKNLIKRYQDSYRTSQIVKDTNKTETDYNVLTGLISEARAGNELSFTSAKTKMAKLMGEVGMLSEADVTRYATPGSLARKAIDKLKVWKEGTPLPLTLKELEDIANTLRSRQLDKLNQFKNEYTKSMSANLGISEDESFRLLGIEKTKKKLSEPIVETESPEINKYLKQLPKGSEFIGFEE